MSYPGLPVGIQTALHQLLTATPVPLHLHCWGKTDIKTNTHRGRSTTDRPPSLTLLIHHPGVIRSLLLTQDPLVLPEAYMHGFIDIEGNPELLIYIFQAFPRIQIKPARFLRAWLEALSLPALPLHLNRLGWDIHSRDHDRRAIQHHYDVGNEFYTLWLDPSLIYSCAYFQTPDTSLEEAQAAKLDIICRKLLLKPGETLLDVGCGWGALLRWAVERYGVQGYGITLSQEQLAFNQQRIAERGWGDRLTVRLLDYRDLPRQLTFDKAVSVGMVEHVGIRHYLAYFRSIFSALKPGGLFLNHGITTGEPWQGTTFGERFIHRYIFPNGELATLSTMLTAAEHAGWEVVDVDAWRMHYARTLRQWAKNLDAATEQAVALIGDRWLQLWKLYLMGSALAFENNFQGIYQTVLRRRIDTVWNIPMTRDRWLCE